MRRILLLAILAMTLGLVTWGIVAMAWFRLGVVPGLGPAVGGLGAALVVAFFLWRIDIVAKEEEKDKQPK